MVALFYLPVTSPLVCASRDPTLLAAWAVGHPEPVIEAAEPSGQAAEDPVDAALRFQTCADMCLLHGRLDDAERFYRRSMRRLVEPCDIDTFSCRAAGYQAMLRDRIEPAASCFQRLSAQGNSTEIRLEARLVLALLFHRASLFAEAHADLTRMADLAISANLPHWLDLAHICGRHFLLLARIHASAELDGHVEWRSAPKPADTIQRLARLPTQASPPPPPTQSPIATLLARRRQHVLRLDLLSDRTHLETDLAISPLIVRTWGHSEPAVVKPQAFIEMTMAALSTRRVRLAGVLLDPVICDHPIPEPVEVADASRTRSGRRVKRSGARIKRVARPAFAFPSAAAWPPVQWPPHSYVSATRMRARDDTRWLDAPVVDPKAALRPLAIGPVEQDYVYAVSRLRVQQGREDEGARHYRSYLTRALGSLGKLGSVLRRCVDMQAESTPLPRTESRPSTPVAHMTPSTPVAGPDDVTRRLPLRYLQAYRYLLEHLSRPDLSMREVAGQARISERSLQMAFRRYLDETPRDLLRRRRMERIHQELLLNPHSQADVMEVALRHGVATRAALLAGYRKYFAQSPTQSLVEAMRHAKDIASSSGPVISEADVAGSS